MKLATTPDTLDLRDRSAARERLLDVAERLFAQRGVAETSVRTITAEAGMNVASVNYYFASKEHLFEAVIERRLPELVRAREVALASALAEGGSVAAILRSWIEPSVRLGFEYPNFARLASRLRFEDDSARWQRYREAQHGLVERYRDALLAALPDFGADEMGRRLHLVFGVIGSTWSHDLSASEESADQVTARLVTFCAAGLSAR
jgi:AcrR family transcriptional regulator